MTDKRTHWESIYQTKKPDSVSWYQPSLRLSLELIRRAGIAKGAALVDVGGGTSTLVDDLLSLGYSNITVLDISTQGLDYSKARLGPRAKSVKWIVGDITAVDPSQLSFDIWHDRAVFHFLVEEQDRKKYCNVLEASLRPGGFIIIATFGPNGPMKCSGLQIVRYDPNSLLLTLGNSFKLISSEVELHRTPSDKTQEFVYCLLQKVKT
ncbi:MAG: class I SAM-dependent methyltransferase [Candidatus Krumholzibacteria bacterium]|nr:class I SAM-dependent methyltransferase [Candidatus Krumholzibacteria bacterium]